MTNTHKTELEKIAAKSLGDSTSYAVYTDQIDSSLLNPMPRDVGFKALNIESNHVGVDVWHGHEMTFLLNSGAPYAGTLKIVYDANTKYMVESKSFKIYLNTFDMCKMGATVEAAISNVEKRIKQDLEPIVQGEVYVRFFKNNADTVQFDNNEYQEFEHVVDIESIDVNDYTGQQNHIKTISEPGSHVRRYTTNALRSRCKVTKQRDIGSAFITVETQDVVVDAESLFKQIVSLREQDEFHEFCSSKLYHEIMSIKGVVGCCVTLLYSRRGSLDICPTRATREDMLPRGLMNVSSLTRKTQGQ